MRVAGQMPLLERPVAPLAAYGGSWLCLRGADRGLGGAGSSRLALPGAREPPCPEG